MIRLLLTDGHLPTREALRVELGARAGLEVVGEAATGAELLNELARTAPTVLLLDLSLPGPDIFALLPVLRQQYPQLRLLARGELTNEYYVTRIFDLGAHGYILKSASMAEFMHGIATVAVGRSFLCSTIGMALVGRLNAAAVPSPAAQVSLGLSKREMEVLVLVAQGMTNAEIALKLFTSKRTIETHRQNIIAKTQAKNTAALIRLAASQGLLPE